MAPYTPSADHHHHQGKKGSRKWIDDPSELAKYREIRGKNDDEDFSEEGFSDENEFYGPDDDGFDVHQRETDGVSASLLSMSQDDGVNYTSDEEEDGIEDAVMANQDGTQQRFEMLPWGSDVEEEKFTQDDKDKIFA